jgi:hypothetical protein
MQRTVGNAEPQASLLPMMVSFQFCNSVECDLIGRSIHFVKYDTIFGCEPITTIMFCKIGTFLDGNLWISGVSLWLVGRGFCAALTFICHRTVTDPLQQLTKNCKS